MDSNKKKVLAWIEENFEMDSIILKDFGVVPGGVLITDRNGATMLVWHDFLTGEIRHEIRGDKNGKQE